MLNQLINKCNLIGIKVSELIQIAWNQGWIQVSNSLPLNEPYSPPHRVSGQQQTCQAEAEYAGGTVWRKEPALSASLAYTLLPQPHSNQMNLSPLRRRHWQRWKPELKASSKKGKPSFKRKDSTLKRTRRKNILPRRRQIKKLYSY